MYAITGATGHTGNIVAKRLLTENQKVRAIGRDMDRLQPLADIGAEAVVCNLSDTPELSRAFAGCEAVYCLMPTDVKSKNYRVFQDRIADSLAAAIETAGVKYVVTLSSIGADESEKTGPVVGLHNLEQRLDAINGLNTLHLRAGYFMENTLIQADIIHAVDKATGPIRPDVKLAMIAVRDIGRAAADSLLRLDFLGHQHRELLGQRDISMTEATHIIGQAIGKPDLEYVQASDRDFVKGATQMGLSTNVANLILEMAKSLNSGFMRPLEPHSAANTTPTTFETFVAEEFMPAYESRMAHV